MMLPVELVEEIRGTCRAQGLDPEDVTIAVGGMVGTDDYVDWTVWGGPAWGQEALRLDIYVLGKVALYNYSVFQNAPVVSSAGTIALDALHTVKFARINDEKSPNVLVFQTDAGESGRLFGKDTDIEKLEHFRRSLVNAIIERRMS